jgi:hypothetical protein
LSVVSDEMERIENVIKVRHLCLELAGVLENVHTISVVDIPNATRLVVSGAFPNGPSIFISRSFQQHATTTPLPCQRQPTHKNPVYFR